MIATLIEKENIPNYKFIRQEVLESEEDRVRRKLNLLRAQTLGNTYKNKVKIFFNTEEGLKSVYTTVWNVGTDYIALKGGITIPISAITDIEL